MINPMLYAGTLDNSKPLGTLTRETILKVICNELNMDLEDVRTKKTRKPEYNFPRQLYAYFCQKYCKISLSKIASYINKKNHATMCHSKKVIENYIDTDKIVKRQVNYFDNIFKNRIVNLTSDQREKIGNAIILKYEQI